MSNAGELLDRIEGNFTHAVIAFLDADGYPMSVATGFSIVPERGVVVLEAVAGDEASPPLDREVNVVFSHIRPQPGVGYDERRYISMWGRLEPSEDRMVFSPSRVQHWDEQDMSFFEFSERGVTQARQYMENASREQGRAIRPKLSPGWLFLRAT